MTAAGATPGGRSAREAARTRRPNVLAALTQSAVVRQAPWLLGDTAAPKGAGTQLDTLRADLAREARTVAEATELSALLHDHVDAWNARHPGAEIAPPRALALVAASPAAWMPRDLADLGAVMTLRTAFEKTCAGWAGGDATPTQLAGLALASAVLDSACLAPRDLAVFAAWLATPSAPFFSAPGLPPWVDLKHRGRPAAEGTPARPLRTLSGTDAAGPYDLRRLFLHNRTLRLIRAFDAAGVPAKAGLAAAAASPKLLMRLIARGNLGPAETSGTPSPARPAFLRGARLALEARPDGPDHTLALIAARRIDCHAATPESWAVAIGAGRGAVTAGDAAFDPGPLTRPVRAAVASGPPASRRPVPETREFFRLYAAVHSGNTRRADRTTADVKLTQAALATRLRARGPGQDWPDSIRLLRDWYLHLLEAEDCVARSVQRYDSTLAAAFAAAAGREQLTGLDPEDFEELYSTILAAETRSASEYANLRRRLRALHGFGVGHPDWDFPEIDAEIFAGDGVTNHVRAVLLARPEIDAARNILRTGMGLAPDVARAADAALLLTSRTGLRIGEPVKALLGHLEDTTATDAGLPEFLWSATLFVRPSRFGDNKTRSASRQIRPFALMTPDEAESFATYLAHRRHAGQTGPLFGVEQPDGSVAPFSGTALGALLAEALRRATGLETPTAHALRRSALTCLFLALHERRRPEGAVPGLLDRLSGWDPDDRQRAAASVVPAGRRREVWAALARFGGHGSPVMRFSAYITGGDLALHDACAGPDTAPGETFEDLLTDFPRHVRFETDAAQGPTTLAPIRGEITEPAAALLKALDLVDAGWPVGAAAGAAELTATFLEDRLPAARAWAALATTKGQLRLQPPERAGKLAPAPLAGAKRAEALVLADRLIGLSRERPEETREWISNCLRTASMGNTGQKLHSPDAFRDWLGIANALCPPKRWLATALKPPGVTGAELARWSGIRPGGMQIEGRKVSVGAGLVVRVRLLGPDQPSANRRRPADSWAGCVRMAAHLAAIWIGCDDTRRSDWRRSRGVDQEAS